jgi:hypothetical protein
MSVEVTSSGFRSPLLNTRNIDIDMIGIPVSGTEVMFGFIGMVDAERPNFHSAKFTVTSAFSQPMELVAQTIGPGGSPFPAGFIVALKNPVATSGTLRVEFDETVAVMNGIGLVYSGLNTASDIIPHTGPRTNPQPPDFTISGTMTVPSGSLVIDMCMTESSNHTTHVVTRPWTNPTYSGIAATAVSMHKFSLANQIASIDGPVFLTREDVGGPFAGATITAVAIETL